MYFFVIEGSATVAGEKLERRDGLGIEDASDIDISILDDSQLLAIEIPMQ